MLLSKFNSRSLMFIFVLLITGCTTTEWSKENTSASAKNKAITKCSAIALEKLPPDNKVTSEQKEGHKEGKRRGITEYYQKDYDYADANEASREVIFNNCMYDSGWESTQRKSELTDFLSF